MNLSNLNGAGVRLNHSDEPLSATKNIWGLGASNMVSKLERAKAYKAQAEEAEKAYRLMLRRHEDAIQSLGEAKRSAELLEEVYAKAKDLAERMSRNAILDVENLVNSALESVFQDRNYKIEIDVSDKRSSKAAEIYLVENIDGVDYRTPVKSSRLSGGVISVIGFVLQVYFICLFGAAPILFVDEGFAAISDEYIENWMSFLKRLRDEIGLTIVLITHDERFMCGADRTYEVDGGKYTLV